MPNQVSLYILAFQMLTLSEPSHAQIEKLPKKHVQACLEKINDATAALTIKDFNFLERISRQLIIDCQYLNDGSDEIGYELLASSLRMQQKIPESRIAISNCLKFHYRSIGCRWELAMIYRDSRNINSCTNVKQEIEALSTLRLEDIRRELESINDIPVKNKDHAKQIENYKTEVDKIQYINEIEC